MEAYIFTTVVAWAKDMVKAKKISINFIIIEPFLIICIYSFIVIIAPFNYLKINQYLFFDNHVILLLDI